MITTVSLFTGGEDYFQAARDVFQNLPNGIKKRWSQLVKRRCQWAFQVFLIENIQSPKAKALPSGNLWIPQTCPWQYVAGCWKKQGRIVEQFGFDWGSQPGLSLFLFSSIFLEMPSSMSWWRFLKQPIPAEGQTKNIDDPHFAFAGFWGTTLKWK